jgi:hypothetical protein
VADSNTAAWPANLAPGPDGTYHILVGDRPQRRVLRVLPTLPAADDVFTEPHKLDCKQQFEAWVRERVVTKS